MDQSSAGEILTAIKSAISDAVIIDETVLDQILTGFLADGHVLIEDVPGTGKTLTVSSFAAALDLSFNRIQFTPDLLPADITGTKVFHEESSSFSFQEGPLFANIVLADELNRASPKTQSALLEAMESQQVTVEGETYDLPDPFFVLATQNPVEQEGTFPLPAAQKDRFIIKTSLGYPTADEELELLNRRLDRSASTPQVESIGFDAGIKSLQEAPEGVDVSEDICSYILTICRRTRSHASVETGVSPRGVQRLLEASRALAKVHGNDFVVPDHVKTIARATLPHRVVLTGKAKVDDVEQSDVIDAILDSVEVPTDVVQQSQ
jgi:MoxR-like ATPase